MGNHDFCSEELPLHTKKMLTNAHYLQDDSVVVEGIKFYGSPYQSWFHNWAWNFPKDDGFHGYPFAKKTWAKIPEDTNVLIVHGPAYKVLDKCMDGREVGCPILRDRMLQLPQLKLAVFGHIHHSYGQTDWNNIKCVNAAICTEKYEPTNPVQVIEYAI
jgi:hypothetical protein